ncbi:MAG TPA: pyridoxal phosphate-dependent aminotransferase [Desulfobacteraceae bacterium]|nr:pyridoxal phosphate-dependent aminotransferase [Desulfobacteraceae bacterium]HPJ67170.1 pyridoxal phosphate-dependent aminotransferase [Desulfobacteraceae bacterium]HPQ26830.1 pyridoxal phosphate-dependent aminotransferase [Desulfobacteraceae bacterium]
MRTNIVQMGADELTYEIRNIIGIVEKLQKLGLEVDMENIGDPVAKGERVPEWLKSIVSELALEDSTYGYCPTQGIEETRIFLSERNNCNGGIRLRSEDIIFFNGLGDAITKVYGLLHSTARVITPSPTYTTHSSSEATHAGLSPITYTLDPHNNWEPDLEELRKKVKYNPAVAGVLIINPDNPTGMVYSEESLREIVSIAREYGLFIIADEIYENLVYNRRRTKSLSDVIGDVPAISMKGISKEFPWPGSRCGWIETYNLDKDSHFASYVKSILNAKMLEVCSTTLPQRAIPRIISHPEYPGHLNERRLRYERFSSIASNLLQGVKGVIANPANGSFYMSVVFEEGVLNQNQSLPVHNRDVSKLIESFVSMPGVSPDKRLVYFLLAAKGICVVPLSSFNTALQGFRVTLLQPEENKFRQMIETLRQGINEYLGRHDN